MLFSINPPSRGTLGVNLAQLILAAFTVFAGMVASSSVVLNDLYFWIQSHYYINPYLCLFAFLLAFSPKLWGLMIIIFLLPLTAGLGNQLNAYFGTQFLVLPNAGLDLVAGFFLGYLLRLISKTQVIGSKRAKDFTTGVKNLVPWPVALVIVMNTISTAIAISRNIYQSATTTSFKGLLFNLMHFRPIDWHDDYMPIADWIAYALAVAMVILVMGQLKNHKDKNQMIFRPIMAGLLISALIGVFQAITGLGLPENLLNFRKDLLGYAAIGFQPDLHAFAGHMLLGAVGFWGYFYSGISKFEKKVVLFIAALCWIGLISSKSRALFLLALAAMVIWLVWYFWKWKRSIFIPAITILTIVSAIFLALIFKFSDNLDGIPVLSWLGALANEFKSRDLTSWSLFSGIFGSRFEIWEAAIRMWWRFPLMGVGQGNFYRLSEIPSFSKSHFLILNHGENAHNYFLQTLTETGIIGAIVFLFALIAPIYLAKFRAIFISIVIAIVSLLLGNIFSHSFLVRENLLIFSVFIGLFYSTALDETVTIKEERTKKVSRHISYGWLLILFTMLVIASSAREIFRSFGKLPFEYGSKCFINASDWGDGWHGGSYTIVLPSGAVGFKISIDSYLPGEEDAALTLQVNSNQKNDIKLSASSIVLNPQRITESTILFSSNGQNFVHPNSVTLTLPRCSTPRNIGFSLDSRRLGFHLNRSIEFIYE